MSRRSRDDKASIATGRVQHFPLSEADADGPQPHQFKSLVTGAISVVSDSAKIVDGAYIRGEIRVDTRRTSRLLGGGRCGLAVADQGDFDQHAAASEDWACYCIVGAGKTSMHSCRSNSRTVNGVRTVRSTSNGLLQMTHGCHQGWRRRPAQLILGQMLTTKRDVKLRGSLVYPIGLTDMTHDSLVPH